MSFLDKLQQVVILPNVLKILGVVLLGWGVFNAWTTASVPTRFLMISGPIAWYIGSKFPKVYKS